MRDINFFKTETGRSPVEEFIDSLPSKQAQKVAWVLILIEEMEIVPSKYFKKLPNTDDIWEVRIVSGNDIYRILGFFDGPDLVVLNHAFQKKTQKTPSRAIRTAESRKRSYLERGKTNE